VVDALLLEQPGKRVEMPIYEFACKKCQQSFEELVFNQSEKIKCPSCGSTKVERAMSVFSFSSGGSYRSSAGSSCDNCAKGNCSSCGGH
jgi:putative FmdB family regulatory protein